MSVQDEDVNMGLPGLRDPGPDATNIFRQLMDAMSRPGKIVDLPEMQANPVGLYDSATALILTLTDYDSPVWIDAALDSKQLRGFLALHAGAPVTPVAEKAHFAFLSGLEGCANWPVFSIGTPEFPDQSTTLIVQVADLDSGMSVTLKGPGIREEEVIRPAGISADFVEWFARNQLTYPCGIDVVFASPRQILAVPRSITMEKS